MHEGALTLIGCIWSLMILYALGVLCITYWLCCSSGGGTMHEGALTLIGCIWSLMVLYALGVLCITYWLCCSSGGGSIC